MSDTAYQRRAEPAPRARVTPAAAGTLAEAPRVAQLKALGAQLNGSAVVQRVVLHKIREGAIRYYSSYEPGEDFATREAAVARDEELRANPDNVTHALISQGRARRMPTNFSYSPVNSVSAAVRGQSSGPHSLSFASTEYRLQQRLANDQQDEIAAQIIPPVEFARQLAEEADGSWDTHRHRERAQLDYDSVYARFQELHGGDQRGIGSEYHEVARRAMQMVPYVTYGTKKGSKPMGERKRAPFGTGTLDLKSKRIVKNPKGLKAYLKMRKKLFHESDSESDRSDYEDYPFSDSEDESVSSKEESELPPRKKRPPGGDDKDGGTGGGGGLAGGILVT